MNILFLSLGKIDDIENKGIYTDLLRQFKKNGHQVYLASPRERRLNLKTEYASKNGVGYLKVRTGNITKAGYLEKGFSTLMIENLYLRAIKKYYGDVKFDLVLYSTPPITFERVVQFIKRRDGAKTYLLLKDIFPQNAVDLKVFGKRSPLYRHFRNKEKKLYKNADYIGCMSPANVEYILRNNPELSKEVVEVCPNSIDILNPVGHSRYDGTIKERYGIPPDKTVFVYGGNLGRPQGIDFIIECLESNRNNEQVYFMIVGAGTEYAKLKDYFDRVKPPNAQLLKLLPENEYELLLNHCDAGLIFLDRRFTIPNFPSRMLSYMRASMPVLAATDVNTDIRQIMEEGQFGFWCESGNVNEFNRNIERLCNKELRKRMGINARKYLEDHYTSSHSYEIIMKHFE